MHVPRQFGQRLNNSSNAIPDGDCTSDTDSADDTTNATPDGPNANDPGNGNGGAIYNNGDNLHLTNVLVGSVPHE